MPTTANLARLAALRGSLMRLSAVQRGELIRAEDWNSVVSALLELAQAVLAEDDAAVLPPHEHKEQVALGWLEPGLRSVLEKGPLGDPVAVDRVQRLERQVAALVARVNSVDDGVGGVRDRLAEVVTRDLVRENDVSSMRRTVDASVDSREDVLALRRSLDTVSTQVKAANDAAARLLVNGQPADLGALAGRLAEVEKLRDALRQGNGELLSAAALDSRFAQLTNTLVTEGELTDALAGHHALLDDGQLASVKGGLQAAMSKELQDAVGLAKSQLDSSVSARLADVDASAARAVADALPALQKAALDAAGANVAAAIGKSQAETAALLDKKLAESSAAQGKTLDGRLADVVSGMHAAVAQELLLQLPSQVAQLNSQLEQLGKALALQSQRLDASELSLSATQSFLNDLQASTGKQLAAQSAQLLAEMAQRDDGLVKQFGQQLKASEAASQAATKAALDSSRTEILDTVSKQKALTGAGALGGASTSATTGALPGLGAGAVKNTGGLSAGGGAIGHIGNLGNLGGHGGLVQP